MFARDQRLRRHGDIERVLRKGRSISTPFFTLKWWHRGDSLPSRFTVVVSTKVSKKAVMRNRIKRRLRELLRRYEERFPAQSDCIIIAKQESVNADFSLFEQEVLRVLCRISR